MYASVSMNDLKKYLMHISAEMKKRQNFGVLQLMEQCLPDLLNVFDSSVIWQPHCCVFMFCKFFFYK